MRTGAVSILRRLTAALAIALAAAIVAPAASAHVQVTPATASPGDTVLFTVLVPNERDSATVQVELQIPDGVVPFSFEETPGWTRSETLAPDESIDVVAWKGSLPAQEFVRFSFLASVPDDEGEIAWPAVQMYADGTKSRWIGPADSEEPAPITRVSSSAAAENAGGEGDETAVETEAATTASAETQATTAETAAAPASSDSGGGSDVIAIVAIAGGVLLLLFGLWALSNSRRRRTR